jgi:hypothetical protein
VLAPSASWRRFITPKGTVVENEIAEHKAAQESKSVNNTETHPRRYGWAELYSA